MDLSWIWVVVRAFFAVVVDRIKGVFENKKPPDPIPVVQYSCKLFSSDNYCDIEQYLNSLSGIEEVQIIPTNSTFVIVLVTRKFV